MFHCHSHLRIFSSNCSLTLRMTPRPTHPSAVTPTFHDQVEIFPDIAYDSLMVFYMRFRETEQWPLISWCPSVQHPDCETFDISDVKSFLFGFTLVRVTVCDIHKKPSFEFILSKFHSSISLNAAYLTTCNINFPHTHRPLLLKFSGWYYLICSTCPAHLNRILSITLGRSNGCVLWEQDWMHVDHAVGSRKNQFVNDCTRDWINHAYKTVNNHRPGSSLNSTDNWSNDLSKRQLAFKLHLMETAHRVTFYGYNCSRERRICFL